jgi:hypothetical protein
LNLMYFGTNYKVYSAEREISLSFLDGIIKALLKHFIGSVVGHFNIVLAGHHGWQNAVGIVTRIKWPFKYHSHARLQSTESSNW